MQHVRELVFFGSIPSSSVAQLGQGEILVGLFQLCDCSKRWLQRALVVWEAFALIPPALGGQVDPILGAWEGSLWVLLNLTVPLIPSLLLLVPRKKLWQSVFCGVFCPGLLLTALVTTNRKLLEQCLLCSALKTKQAILKQYWYEWDDDFSGKKFDLPTLEPHNTVYTDLQILPTFVLISSLELGSLDF